MKLVSTSININRIMRVLHDRIYEQRREELEAYVKGTITIFMLAVFMTCSGNVFGKENENEAAPFLTGLFPAWPISVVSLWVNRVEASSMSFIDLVFARSECSTPPLITSTTRTVIIQ